MIVWLAHEANLSGANIALMEYAAALQEEFDFHFILPHTGNMVPALKSLGFTSTVIYQYGWAVPSISKSQTVSLRVKLRSLKATRDTIRLIKKLEAKIVFTNTQIPFTAAMAADKLQLPHVWWLHEFGEEDFGFKIGFGREAKADRLMKKSKLIVCNSEAVKQKFSARMPEVHMERIYQPVCFKKRPGIEDPAPFIKYIMFGQIVSSKGHMEVLEAMAAAKKVSPVQKFFLHITGPSEDAAYLERLNNFITENDLQHEVKIETGFFEKEVVLPLYDVLIVASQAEAFGRVIIEAGKAGLKVIVKNSGGAPELINETNGLLYKDKMELTEILTGEIAMPKGPIEFNYKEEEEIGRLKKYLAIL